MAAHNPGSIFTDRGECDCERVQGLSSLQAAAARERELESARLAAEAARVEAERKLVETGHSLREALTQQVAFVATQVSSHGTESRRFTAKPSRLGGTFGHCDA